MTLRTITGQAGFLIALAVLLVAESGSAFAKREASELTLLPSATVIVAPEDVRQVAALLQELLRKASQTDEGFTILDEIHPAETGDRVVIALGDTPFAESIDMTGVRTMG
jgi:hypothetical protein